MDAFPLLLHPSLTNGVLTCKPEEPVTAVGDGVQCEDILMACSKHRMPAESCPRL